MHIIDPAVMIIDDADPLLKIEKAARTCYKSEDKITEGSALKMFNALVRGKHFAMLEHATFVFDVNDAVYKAARRNKFLNSTCISADSIGIRYLVSGNLRAINDSNIPELIACIHDEANNGDVLAYNWTAEMHRYCDEATIVNAAIVNLEKLPYVQEQEIQKHRYTTMRFITDRGVTHELVRHRLFSFAQESTRYVNYNKDKYGGGDIKFITPANYSTWSMDKQQAFCGALEEAEKFYNDMIRFGATPQEARAVLPNAVKTEIVVTGNDGEWQHFFDLRSRGLTGAPHPDIKVVADKALELYNN